MPSTTENINNEGNMKAFGITFGIAVLAVVALNLLKPLLPAGIRRMVGG